MDKDVRISVATIVDDYLDKGDSATENANGTWTPSGLLSAVGGAGLAKDNLARIEEAGFTALAQMHKDGAVHIHDLSLGFSTPYCSGWSLQTLLAEGIRAGAVRSKPAKHLRTAVNHMINFIGAASNEFAGAQAFSDVDILLAPYAYKVYLDLLHETEDADVAFFLTRKEVKQCIQELLFHLNYNNRWGGQTPFSNITMAITCPDDLKNSAILVAGVPLSEHGVAYKDAEDKTYGDMTAWQKLVTDSILDTFMEGDAQGNGFTFPVLTINVTPEFFKHPTRHKIFELTAKFGTPYFQNFINGYSAGQKINPDDVRSMCCRLSINEKEIQKHVGGLFGHADQTGSLQVVTISLPYLAAQAEELAQEAGGSRSIHFFDLIKDSIERIKEEQLWKRDKVEEFFRKGLFPISKTNLGKGFKTYFTTVGFIGLWECVQILTGNEDSLLDEDGLKLGEAILEFMRGEVEELTNSTGKLFNMEATPAESASYTLAKKALKAFPNIKHQGLKKSPYFTNSCHIPVEYQDDLEKVFRTQNVLQPIPSGGTVVHFYLGDEMTTKEVESSVKFICESTKLPYFSLTTVYSMCEICGRIPGKHEVCPNEHTEEQIADLKERRPDLVSVNE